VSGLLFVEVAVVVVLFVAPLLAVPRVPLVLVAERPLLAAVVEDVGADVVVTVATTSPSAPVTGRSPLRPSGRFLRRLSSTVSTSSRLVFPRLRLSSRMVL
jgi:hypothetical protein